MKTENIVLSVMVAAILTLFLALALFDRNEGTTGPTAPKGSDRGALTKVEVSTPDLGKTLAPTAEDNSPSSIYGRPVVAIPTYSEPQPQAY